MIHFHTNNAKTLSDVFSGVFSKCLFFFQPQEVASGQEDKNLHTVSVTATHLTYSGVGSLWAAEEGWFGKVIIYLWVYFEVCSIFR